MDSWDDENFEPQVVIPVTVASNKWEGEDEDEDVKDNWEDDDEEKKEETPVAIQQKPKKKTIQEKIAEKERIRAEELARKRKEEEEDDEEDDIPPEERLRRQKESDLNAALETTFGGSNDTQTGIDGMDPKSKEEFQEFADAILNKVQPYTKSAEYPVFAENVVRNICATMSSLDIKKIKNTIDNLYMEKQKIEKGDKAKKSKTKGKAKLKMDNENQFSAYVEDYDEFDDFM